MLAAFATGALASALVAAAAAGLVLWVVALLFFGGDVHELTPAIAGIIGLVVGGVVLIAEGIAHRRTREAWTVGEPWAYRGPGGSDRARRYGDPRG